MDLVPSSENQIFPSLPCTMVHVMVEFGKVKLGTELSLIAKFVIAPLVGSSESRFLGSDVVIHTIPRASTSNAFGNVPAGKENSLTYETVGFMAFFVSPPFHKT